MHFTDSKESSVELETEVDRLTIQKFISESKLPKTELTEASEGSAVKLLRESSNGLLSSERQASTINDETSQIPINIAHSVGANSSLKSYNSKTSAVSKKRNK